MSGTNGDPTLRRAFAELRDVDRRSIPEFDTVLGRPGRRPTLRFGGRAGITVLVAALAVVVLMIVRRPSRDVPVQSISEWRSPTDVLLRTPGVEVLQSVPVLQSSVIDRIAPQVNFHSQEKR